MTTRQDKVNSLIQKELGKILLTENYEEITGFLTITAVFVTGDLSEARVSISVMGQDAREVLRVLEKNIYQIQGTLNKSLFLRKPPRIKFVIDQSGEHAEHISGLIRRVKND